MSTPIGVRALAHHHDEEHGISVPVTRIPLADSPGGTPNEPLDVYRTEGPACEPEEGLASLREQWIADRGDTEQYEGRARNLHDDGRSATRRGAAS
ncbi:MAG TPA: phosphomethylpyrimidine synthase ThiC, partial [Microbacterium sp.]|nr:phosphomethylpyrimidine synthase ThiC [Microbacterium sp.]